MVPASAVTALIVDDHPLFVDALALALQPLLGGGRLFTAGALTRACQMLAVEKVDLVLLDLVLPDSGGVEGIARVREYAASARVAVISGRSDLATVSLARAVGADAFISKSDPFALIQAHLGDVLAGKPVFPDHGGATDLAAKIALLTPAQARILAAAATGKLNKQIAADMHLAEATVKTHMSAILKRLGVNNRTQAILALAAASQP